MALFRSEFSSAIKVWAKEMIAIWDGIINTQTLIPIHLLRNWSWFVLHNILKEIQSNSIKLHVSRPSFPKLPLAELSTVKEFDPLKNIPFSKLVLYNKGKKKPL